MTFMWEHGTYPIKMYPQTKYELSTSRLSKTIVLKTDRQTDRHIYRQTYMYATENIFTTLRGW